MDSDDMDITDNAENGNDLTEEEEPRQGKPLLNSHHSFLDSFFFFLIYPFPI